MIWQMGMLQDLSAVMGAVRLVGVQNWGAADKRWDFKPALAMQLYSNLVASP